MGPEPVRDSLRRILQHSRWTLLECETCSEATAILRNARASVVICEATLADRTWADVFECCNRLPVPPPMIVCSRLADDRLWTEVLNRGGYNLLDEPFQDKEVYRLVSLAWRHWKDLPPARAHAAAT